jgi:hypothetical protein
MIGSGVKSEAPWWRGQNSSQINRLGIASIEQCSVALNRVVGSIMILPNRCPKWVSGQVGHRGEIGGWGPQTIRLTTTKNSRSHLSLHRAAAMHHQPPKTFPSPVLRCLFACNIPVTGS